MKKTQELCIFSFLMSLALIASFINYFLPHFPNGSVVFESRNVFLLIYALISNFKKNFLFSVFYFFFQFLFKKIIFINIWQLLLDYFFPLLSVNVVCFFNLKRKYSFYINKKTKKRKFFFWYCFAFLTNFSLTTISHTLSGTFFFLLDDNETYFKKLKISFFYNFPAVFTQTLLL